MLKKFLIRKHLRNFSTQTCLTSQCSLSSLDEGWVQRYSARSSKEDDGDPTPSLII